MIRWDRHNEWSIKSVSLNALTGDRTYFLRITNAGSERPFELRPGDHVTDFTVTETQTTTGLVRQQIRTLRTFGQTELDLSGKQRSTLTLTGVFQNTGTSDQGIPDPDHFTQSRTHAVRLVL